MTQMMMRTDPLYRATLLLLLQQCIGTKVRRLVMESCRGVGLVQRTTWQMLRHSLLQVLDRGSRGTLGPVIYPAAIGATGFWASRAESLFSRRDRVRGRRAGAEGPSRSLAVRLLDRRRFLLVLLLLVRTAVIVLDFPLMTA